MSDKNKTWLLENPNRPGAIIAVQPLNGWGIFNYTNCYTVSAKEQELRGNYAAIYAAWGRGGLVVTDLVPPALFNSSHYWDIQTCNPPLPIDALEARLIEHKEVW